MTSHLKKSKDEGYFCVCEECGSCGWMDETERGDSIFNSLEKDGSMLIPKGLLSIKINQDEYFYKTANANSIDGGLFDDFTCVVCEKKVKPIGFSKVNLAMRKSIANMNAEERKEWIKSFKMVEELEKDG